jgi:hypothetical protein
LGRKVRPKGKGQQEGRVWRWWGCPRRRTEEIGPDGQGVEPGHEEKKRKVEWRGV